LRNILTFRGFIRQLLRERKEEMSKSDFKQANEDFLTMLLRDELFKDNEEMIIDECITFMAAATSTT
jgi:cytochrome P450